MVKEHAHELINCLSDENVLDVIKFVQDLKMLQESPDAQTATDDGSLKFLFRDYVDDGIREPIIDFGVAVGNEKW
jgi:hypothetical protein